MDGSESTLAVLAMQRLLQWLTEPTAQRGGLVGETNGSLKSQQRAAVNAQRRAFKRRCRQPTAGSHGRRTLQSAPCRPALSAEPLARSCLCEQQQCEPRSRMWRDQPARPGLFPGSPRPFSVRLDVVLVIVYVPPRLYWSTAQITSSDWSCFDRHSVLNAMFLGG